MKTPEFRVYATKLYGAPYTAHSIVLADGRTVHSQLSPYGVGEAEARVRAFLTPEPLPVRTVKFNNRIRSPGRPRKGEAWRSNDQPEDLE